ncbi:MAG: helix-turn-helix transcriptional regulator [Atopobiaceae bacterium]|nr:helix-turn-helix transcriptional regulator [Atopobiaceae bacterium]
MTLKDLRQRKGIMQSDMASRLEVSSRTYARYEEQPELMTISQAQIVCDILRIDLDFLVPMNVRLTNILVS